MRRGMCSRCNILIKIPSLCLDCVAQISSNSICCRPILTIIDVPYFPIFLSTYACRYEGSAIAGMQLCLTQ